MAKRRACLPLSERSLAIELGRFPLPGSAGDRHAERQRIHRGRSQTVLARQVRPVADVFGRQSQRRARASDDGDSSAGHKRGAEPYRVDVVGKFRAQERQRGTVGHWPDIRDQSDISRTIGHERQPFSQDRRRSGCDARILGGCRSEDFDAWRQRTGVVERRSIGLRLAILLRIWEVSVWVTKAMASCTRVVEKSTLNRFAPLKTSAPKLSVWLRSGRRAGFGM